MIECLGKAGFTCKPAKCEFGRKYMLYLGHRIGNGTLAVPDPRVEAMLNYRQPITKRQLRAFLGSMGYYRDFMEGFANWSYLLTLAVSLSAPARVQWTPERTQAFCKLKSLLCSKVLLFIPVRGDVFCLCTDASGAWLGACLHVV